MSAGTPTCALLFSRQRSRRNRVAPVTGRAFLPGIFNGAAKLQSVFVSDSIAPWFWYFTVPVWIVIILILVTAARTLAGFPRVLLIYFGTLFGCMTIIGIVGTRRLLFVTGWLLLPCVCTLAQASERRRKVIASALIAVAAMGWTGTWSRRFYAAQDFPEPWQEVASRSATLVKNGGAIVTNSPVFLFYSSPQIASHAVNGSQVYFVDNWRDLLLISAPAQILFIAGVNKSAEDETEAAGRWLEEQFLSG